MAEAHKCDVTDCNVFEEGAPDAKFIFGNVSKSLCRTHTQNVLETLFPDLLPKDEEKLKDEENANEQQAQP